MNSYTLRRIFFQMQRQTNNYITYSRDYIESIDPTRIIFFHAIINFFTALLLFSVLRNALLTFSKINNNINVSRHYFAWIQPYYFPNHKFTIFTIIITIAITSIIIIVSFFLMNNRFYCESKSKQILNSFFLAIFFLVFVILFVFFGLINTPTDYVFFVLSLLFIILMPLFNIQPFFTNKMGNFVAIVLLCICLIQICLLCFFFASGRMPIMADYMQLPTSTIIKEGRSDVKISKDTLTLINQNRIWGNQQVPDPRRWSHEDAPCPQGNKLHLPRNLVMDNFVRIHKYTFYYSFPNNELCFVGRINSDIIRQLIEIFPEHRTHINNVSALNNIAWRQIDEIPASDEIISFNILNKIHYITFIHDLELIFHHHFQILNPIKEWRLGRSLVEIIAPYGLNFLAINEIMKYTGGFTHQSYITTIFVIQLLYVLIFISIVFYLYRNVFTTFLAAAVFVGCLNGLGVTTLYSSTGYGPVRHGLDLAVFLFLSLYLRHEKPSLLLLAIVFGLSNMFLDRFVGSFCPLALASVLLLRGIARHGQAFKFELLMGTFIIGLIIVLFNFLGTISAPNPYAQQFFDGVWGFPIRNVSILFYLILLFFGLMFSLWSINFSFNNGKFIPIFFLAYTTCFLFYWLMVPNYGHLYKMYPIAVLAAISLWHECVAEICSNQTKRRAAFLALVVGVTFWFNMSRHFASTAWEHFHYFNSHNLYDWNFERVKAVSATNPNVLSDAVDLIRKETKINEAIYILSEFDSLLLFLADRTSAMPHFEIPTFLNSHKHLNLTIEHLINNKPDKIIVDSCIRCSAVPYRLTALVDGLSLAYQERSLQKVDRLQRLKEVYQAIANDYDFDDKQSSNLVSVLRRRH